MATAQHREMLDQILEFFEIDADVDFDLMRKNQGLADLTSRRITAVDGGSARTAMLVGPHADRILSEASRLLYDDDAYAEMAQAQNPHGDGTASERICDELQAWLGQGGS